MLRASLLAAAILSLAGRQPVRAQPADIEPAAWRVSIAPTIGALALDSHLADYRWNTSLAIQPGLRVALHHARFATALRTAWAGTEQATGIPGETSAPKVNMTQLDLALEGRITNLGSIELWGLAHGGRMFLGYEPDHMTFDAGGSPVTVDFDPITEWCYGLGIALRRDLARHLALGLQLDQTVFRLDTAHRSGDEIVESRESFSNWSFSLALLGFMDLN